MQQEKKFRWDWCILYWNIFFYFSCDIELKIYTTKYSNLLLIILILVWIVCSTLQKRRNFDAKVTCHQPICLLLHAILSGVGVSHWVLTNIATNVTYCAIQCPKYREYYHHYVIFIIKAMMISTSNACSLAEQNNARVNMQHAISHALCRMVRKATYAGLHKNSAHSKDRVRKYSYNSIRRI